LGRSERDEHQNKNRFVTVENSMGRVHKSQGKLKPISAGMKSECEIIAGIASAFFKEQSNIDWKTLGTNYSLIRQKISQVFSGFDNYTERSQKEGFYLPNNARIADFSKLPKGKAVFTVCILPEHNLTEGEFLLTTIRSHDQFNTTIYGLDDRYRGIYNERRVVFINPDDANKLNFKKLDKIDLLSNYNGIKRRAKNFLIIPYNIPRGNLAAYFPETNILIPHDEYADKSNTPISKSVKVTIESANS
jgi:anaerobic selenocysteine-containing dehydrogenase